MATDKPTYAELLRHPEWQQKRLRVMDRARFRCEECGDKETTLNVHHSYYTKGAKPWEYPDASLKCLCEKCHEARTAHDQHARQLLGLLDLKDLMTVCGYVIGYVMNKNERGEAENLRVEHLTGIADAWRLSADRLIERFPPGSRVGFADLLRLFDEAQRQPIGPDEAEERASP